MPNVMKGEINIKCSFHVLPLLLPNVFGDFVSRNAFVLNFLEYFVQQVQTLYKDPLILLICCKYGPRVHNQPERNDGECDCV